VKPQARRRHSIEIVYGGTLWPPYKESLHGSLKSYGKRERRAASLRSAYAPREV
jgi:hypothetical protein